MPIMPITDGALYYEVHGEGPPLLLAAGLGGVGAFWAPQLDALTPQFRVVLHDHRGTGQSSRDRITYSVGQMAGTWWSWRMVWGSGGFTLAGTRRGRRSGRS